ncbi:hypothetical protein PRUPE_4G181500 [Prunus persica]|uniref:Metallothionein n=1 Tax=Prunus persica TaxID=3760 RepID=A0A251PME9_PRUPE|nr:hypothetical protein PRUPE_4G181500 [Prunus persica]
MSSKCSDCNCTDSSQCTSMDTVIMDAPAAENDGKCKCAPSCSCVDCKCGN